MGARPKTGKGTVDALGLQIGEIERQRLAFGRHIKEPLAAILRALALHHIALIDELLEHAAERLLGDLEDVEQLRNLHAGIAIDEMQHPVMGAPEAEFRQYLVGITDEVAIGEEQELDQVVRHRLGGGPERRIVSVGRGWGQNMPSKNLGQPY